jgi:uncharacterized DUF497 family protein
VTSDGLARLRPPAPPAGLARLLTEARLRCAKLLFATALQGYSFYTIIMIKAGVDFEFDPEKSAANLAKHGIDFEDAKALWADDDRIEVEARSQTEPRRAMIGMIEGRLWVAFFTLRAEAIRIISVRRARDREVKAYERQKDR